MKFGTSTMRFRLKSASGSPYKFRVSHSRADEYLLSWLSFAKVLHYTGIVQENTSL